MGRKGQGASPWKAGRAPHLGPMRLGFWGNPKGGAPLAWGASFPSPWPPPASRSLLEGPAPFPLLPTNRGVEGGL